MKPVEVAVNEHGFGEVGAPAPQVLAVQPPQPVVGLRPEEFQKLLQGLIDAIKGRGSLFASLHELSDEQEALVKAFTSIAGAMGVRRFEVFPVPVERRGLAVKVRTPRGAARARVFLRSGVVELEAAGDAEVLYLAECTRADDKIARIEFLDGRGRVLAVTGGEIPPNQN